MTPYLAVYGRQRTQKGLETLHKGLIINDSTKEGKKLTVGVHVRGSLCFSVFA